MNSKKNTANNNCCINCLLLDENNIMQCYQIKNGILKTIFQGDYLSLCYVCLKIISNAEAFIQNVQSNQIYLENYDVITESILETAKLQLQPIITLSNASLSVLELNENESTEEASFIVYGTGNARNESVKLEVKDELLDYLDEDLLRNSDDDTPIKEEDCNVPLISFKKSAKLNKSKPIKKVKVKKKHDKEIENSDIVKGKNAIYGFETLRLTKEQCMEERKNMANNKNFISALYKCTDCVKWFACKNGYEKHMEKHDKVNGEYKCDICQQRRDSADKLMKHLRYHSVRYRCSECGLTRISRLTMQDHYTAHHADGPAGHFACSHCVKSFKRQVSLRKHIEYAHSKKTPAQCNICNKTYRTKETLKAHLFRKHLSEMSAGEVPYKRYECDQCGKAFRAPSQLRNHMSKHSASRNYYCVECDKSFKSDMSLKQHLKIAAPHVNYTELPLGCDQCERRFSTRRDLQRHTNRVHLNVRPHRCDRCDKGYLSAWSLAEHKRFAHDGHRRPLNYPCPMCEKVFDRNTTMKAHIRTHTGERPYKCPKCRAEFSQAGVLGTHIKLVHLKLTRDGRPKNSVAAK